MITSILDKYENINLHINYLEPWAFLLYIKDLDAKYINKIKFMNIPLQSLSQKLLDRMNRKYNGQNIINEIKKFKIKYKNIKVVTQMIYWFPGESIGEFKESLKVLDVFDSTSFFCFSPKIWTIAANYELLTDQELYKRTLLLFKISQNTEYSTYIHLSDSKYKKIIENKYGTIWSLR